MPELIQQYAGSYKKNGYVVLPSAVSHQKVAKIRSDIATLFCKQLGFLGIKPSSDASDQGLLENMCRLFDESLERYQCCLRQVNKLVSVYEALCSEQVLSFVQHLGFEVISFPTDAVFHCMANRLRIPNGYMRLAPHQDWPAMQSSLDAVIVWAPLMDVNTEAGFPLEMIPQSHLQGLLPGITHDHVYEVDPNYYDPEEFSPVYANRGDVIIFSAFCVHKTGDHTGDFLRLACSTRFENVTEKTNVIRGYPSIHRRVVDREIRTQGFPKKEDVAEVFEQKER